MKEMKYEKAIAEVVKFDNSDVITTSVACGPVFNSYVNECTNIASRITDCRFDLMTMDPGNPDGPGEM